MSGGLQIAILAAGEATRFGATKLDTEIAGKALGCWALESALALDPARLIVIVPSKVPAFARMAAEAGRTTLIVNPDATGGLSTSVATAAADAAGAGSDVLLLMLADMPAVSPETLRLLVARVSAGGPSAVRHGSGSAGIPACFPSDYFEALQALEGDRGAAVLLRGAPGLQLIDAGADELGDVDTLDDLTTVARTLTRRS